MLAKISMLEKPLNTPKLSLVLPIIKFAIIFNPLANAIINPIIDVVLLLNSFVIIVIMVGYNIDIKNPVNENRMIHFPPSIRPPDIRQAVIAMKYIIIFTYPNFSARNPPNILPTVNVT